MYPSAISTSTCCSSTGTAETLLAKILVAEMMGDVLVGFLELGDGDMAEILGGDFGISALNGKIAVDIEVLNPMRLLMAALRVVAQRSSNLQKL